MTTSLGTKGKTCYNSSELCTLAGWRYYFQIVGLKVGQFFTDQDGQWLVRTSVIGLMKDNMLYH